MLGRLMKQDLGLKSRIVQLWPLLAPPVKERRAGRATKLLNRLKGEDKGKVRVFSEEKIFTTNVTVKCRNSRYLTSSPVSDVDPTIRFNHYTKVPLKQMVLGVVASEGQKCPPIFVAAGKRINAAVYQNLLRQHVVPWLQRTYPDGNYVFQQDSAPAHAASTTHEFLSENMALSATAWSLSLPREAGASNRTSADTQTKNNQPFSGLHIIQLRGSQPKSIHFSFYLWAYGPPCILVS
jgi:hypothetical protein